MHQKKLFDKYLELLGVKKSQPDFNLLKKIVRSHLINIPFENISKLLYKKQGMSYIPDLSRYLDGIKNYNFGGTCYVNNYYLYLLLKDLGYYIKLCGADMKKPDVHIFSIVAIDNNEYIIDCGYAAPFFEPLPRDLNNDFIISFGHEKYLIKPKDESERTTVEQYYKNDLQHWYIANPKPRKIEEFDKVIKESYADDAVFMNAIRITRFLENGSLVLKNLSLTETVNQQSSTIKILLKDIPSIIQEKFGLPMDVVENAVGHFKELKDIYG